jgi:hypothetical protein
MVTLSGGPFGGDVYDGSDWSEGEVVDLDGALYRRDGDQAVFVGMAS